MGFHNIETLSEVIKADLVVWKETSQVFNFVKKILANKNQSHIFQNIFQAHIHSCCRFWFSVNIYESVSWKKQPLKGFHSMSWRFNLFSCIFIHRSELFFDYSSFPLLSIPCKSLYLLLFLTDLFSNLLSFNTIW